MPGRIQLDPGPPSAIWNSDGIRLRPEGQRESNPSTTSPHVRPVSGASYFTYVKVSNTGPDPIGGCLCSATGTWRVAAPFIDTFPPPTFPIASPDGLTRLVRVGTTDFRLEPAAGGTALAGPWPLGQGAINSFWAWSPDGLFFAVVTRNSPGTGATWTLRVYATRTYTRGDGIRSVPAGTIFELGPVNSTAANAIAGSNLGWNAASTCLFLRRPPQPPQLGPTVTEVHHTLVCPYADNTSNTSAALTIGPIRPSSTGLNGWVYVHSPCGHLVARVPLPDPNPMTVPTGLRLQIIDIRRTLRDDLSPKQDNVSVTVEVDRATTANAPATLTTTGPGRRGIALGRMSTTAIDNPECASVQAATVNVRRARVTTIPNQIDYTSMGQAAVAVWQGSPVWVEFPSLRWVDPSGSTPGQVHFCLQAMGDASPGDPAPGWANVNLGDRHYAQRNIIFA